MFGNRRQAGELLCKELADYKNHKDAVIVTIPRGGVPIGYTLAKKLDLPLELVLSKKIGHPFNKEYAIGAATLDSKILDPFAAAEVSELYINDEIERIRELLSQRFKWYYGTKEPTNLKDKIVILVDDGVATGNTLISSIQLIQQQRPAEIIVALPVGSKSALKKIKELTLVENIICLNVPENFHAVGQFYDDFSPVHDEDVIKLLKKANENYLQAL
ncbi:MAG: phosphoribosyltransferase family protein [Flavobacteriaceae bacterium]|nr:phosphoribosyltransferase family protein [Flavobacteriaceae bacterium]